ncbi:protein translocase subunit SecF [Methanococcus voltae]|uniref:Protein-export membrane protein SecF n=2 Tax=Methanococcus voltae TaxID=2188 RepID=A0A8J7REU1_METVO|nr:protein translocase subunit SecF [Methanococcus voltae]MBP2172164.1 preprotein translocase subunit SecF [Methanococcus voltae]MBP2200879.1 preprotein translocase subunit SecF [Methanococcus voltae]MCS3921603.1 preprotein translocase subunit SecF [Methanococcus voltae PS]
MYKNYKVLTVIPVILALLSVVFVSVNGLNQSIDVSGGTEITVIVPNNFDYSSLEKQYPDVDFKISTSSSAQYLDVKAGTNVDIDGLRNSLATALNTDDLSKLQYTEKQIGSTLSSNFWSQGFQAVGFAFLFMAIVVYAIFRTPVPSFAVILAAASDIVIAVGGMSLFGIPISTSTIAALLMLIGYSVDTDIMLTTRVLKRKSDTLENRINQSMKTGMTMSITTIVAMAVLYLVVSYIVPAAEMLKDISIVLLIGLIADLMLTWVTNVGILRYYVTELKKSK